MYYTDNITEIQADSALSFFKKIGYFNNANGVTVQIDKIDTTYKVRFVVKKEYFTNHSLDFLFKLYGNMASKKAFDGKNAEIDLCDNVLKTQRTIK